MDQYANMFGQQDHLILLDCREGSHQTIKVNFSGYCLLLFNTNVKHELGNSEYNIRRQECEAGVSLLQKHYPEVSSLRDCRKYMLAYLKAQEYETIHRRCEYVIEENERVVQGSRDLMKGDLKAFGRKMYQSHQGLSEKYQVSCQELDLLVDLTRQEQTILGARMMGGGFGGCTINLIKEHAVEELVKRIGKEYLEVTGKDMTVYPVNIADGTSLTVTELIK